MKRNQAGVPQKVKDRFNAIEDRRWHLDDQIPTSPPTSPVSSSESSIGHQEPTTSERAKELDEMDGAMIERAALEVETDCDNHITELIGKILKAQGDEQTDMKMELVTAFEQATAKDIANMDPAFVAKGKQIAESEVKCATDRLDKARAFMKRYS